MDKIKKKGSKDRKFKRCALHRITKCTCACCWFGS